MADQDWYAGDVYDDNQYDDDQQQQRQQQPTDAAAAPAAPPHVSTQPYPRGATTPRGRGEGARPDVSGGGRNPSKPVPAPGRDLGRVVGQPQAGRERGNLREPHRGGDNWQHWDGRESSRDYKDAPPRDLPRDAFREDRSGNFRDSQHRDFGGRAGFRDGPIPRDGPPRDDPREFHSGRDYRAEPQNFREPPPSGFRHGPPGPRVESRDSGGFRDQPPPQPQHFRDSRDAPHYRDQPPPRDHHAFGGRGRGGELYDGPVRSFGQSRDAHDDQHFPRDRRGEPSQPFREGTHGHDHRENLRDGPNHRDHQPANYRDHQPAGFRDNRDYSSHRESHPMPQQDYRDNSGYRDASQRFPDPTARPVRDGPNYRQPQAAHRDYSGHRESQPAPHYKDGVNTTGTADRERERDKVFIPRDRDVSDISAGHQVKDQPPVQHIHRSDPLKTHHHTESLHSQSLSQSQLGPVIPENVVSNQGSRDVPSVTPPIEQHRKVDDRPLPTTARDAPAPSPASLSAAGHAEKNERARFNNQEGRIYLGRVDWMATKSDLVKLCEKYVDTFFCVLFPFDLLLKVR